MADEPVKPDAEQDAPKPSESAAPEATAEAGGAAVAAPRVKATESTAPEASAQGEDGTATAADVKPKAKPAAPSATAEGGDAAATPKPKPAAPAAKAAKPPAPPDPRVVEATAKAEKIRESIAARLGADAVEEVSATKEIPIVRISAAKWREAVTFLKESPEHAYDYVELMAGTDYKDYIEVVIYLHSTKHGTYINAKTRTPRDNAQLPSLTPVHSGVNWEEREVYDLLGVHFEGHPDLRRIMMWEEWNGHPLRKDYSDFENIPSREGDHS
ncbi:MAG: NADH-quinone oxidoreductase subunit C [Firmicutes bacterium]|nr:NADH-quinone oxidoreductase subunit C [Bacillota bacterium]